MVSNGAIDHQLSLVPLDAGAWRLCDSTLPASHPASVVAYIEVKDDLGYEVVWTRGNAGSQYFLSMDEVLQAATDLLERAPVTLATKPIPIAHRSPLAHRRVSAE